MTELVRIRVPWSGAGLVGAGLSTFYTTTAGSGLPAAVRGYFEAVKSQLHTGITATVPNNGDTIDDVTGDLTGTWSEPSGGGVTTFTGAGMFVQGVGYRQVWETDGINAGRRVRGATFWVPLDGDTFDTNGLILPGAVSIFDAAATAFRAAAPDLVIWSPPKTHRDALGNRVIDRPGKSSAVIGQRSPTSISWLRSRRT